MEKNAKKNMLFLVLAGAVLVAVNSTVWFASKNGQVAPIANIPLWGVFVVLNTLSLLWAVSLLGLQPMVVAASYVAGGLMAYQGAKLLPSVDLAGLTTTGATYGAFGALAVGNATTKVRLAFFSKSQVPFIFIIVALLALDGLINSCISNPDWSVVLNALVFPFLFAGVVIGLVWFVALRFDIGKRLARKPASLAAIQSQPLEEDESDEDSMQLMFKVPGRVAAEEPEFMAEEMDLPEPEPAPAPVLMEVIAAPVEHNPPAANTDADDHFFPLEIDKDDDFILPPAEIDTMALEDLAIEDAVAPFEAAVVVDEEIPPSPPPIVVEDPVVFALEEEPPAPVVVTPEPVKKPESRGGSNDWLSDHLDLLNRIKK